MKAIVKRPVLRRAPDRGLAVASPPGVGADRRSARHAGLDVAHRADPVSHQSAIAHRRHYRGTTLPTAGPAYGSASLPKNTTWRYPAGSTSTITTEPAPPLEACHRPPGLPTSLGITASTHDMRRHHLGVTWIPRFCVSQFCANAESASSLMTGASAWAYSGET